MQDRETRNHFLLVLALALLVRVAGLDRFPPGLWFDEGLNGVDAWRSLAGGEGLRWVYPAVFPREPLLVWALSPVLWLAGPSVLALRLVPVAIGTLACGLFYLTLRRVEPARGAGFALAGAFVLSTLHWHAHFSRLVFRTNWVPLLALLGLCLAAWAVRRGGRARLLAAGAALGLGFYAYLSWYFFLPVAALFVWALAREREGRAGRALLYVAAGAAALWLPLLLHYALRPGDLTGRVGALSPLAGGPLAALRLVSKNALDVLLMFGIRGDHVPKHNLPGWPVFEPVWFGFFVVGLAAGLAELRRGGRLAGAWLAWLVLMSLPSVFSQTDSANQLRNLGATPAVAYWCARGFHALWTRPALRGRLARGLLLALLVWGGLFQVAKLWHLHPRVEGIAQAFSADQLALYSICEPDPQGAPIFVPTDFYTHYSFRFLALERPDLRPLEPARLMAREPGVPARDHRLLCTSLSNNYPRLRERFPGGRVEGPKLMLSDRPFAWILRIPAAALLEPAEARRLARELELNPAR